MREALLPLWLAAVTLSMPAAPAAAAAQPAGLTLQQALEQALQQALPRHPELAAAISEVEAAEAARLQAGAWPDPVLETELEDTRRETRTTTLLITQAIELGGQRGARIDAADRAQEIARSQLAARRSSLRADVTAAFVQAQTAQERVRLAHDSLQLAQRGSDAAAKRVTAGKIAPIDVTKAQVAEAGVRLELGQARGELRAALLGLAAIVGTGQTIERVEGTVALPAVPSDEVVQARLDAAPVLRQARLEVDRLGALARLERARRVPDVSVGVGARHSAELGRNQAMLVLSMPLPLFDGRRGAEVEALRKQDKARYEAEAAALRLRAEAARAHERLKASVAEAEAMQRDVLPGAEAAHEAAARGFELGKFGFLDVLDAQRTLLEARTRHLRAHTEAHRAAAELDRLLGAEGDDTHPIRTAP